jgi:hypothetical protein
MMMTNILLFLMMITMACVGYASAYKIMQREIVERDIQLHMAYTFIEKRLNDRPRKARVRST